MNRKTEQNRNKFVDTFILDQLICVNRSGLFIELGSVMHQCHVIASEMVHFIQQVQYYINFEVRQYVTIFC